MAKPGGNKKRCEKYKNSGRREENKRLRQIREQKRRDRFAKRREEGKACEYEPNPYEKGTAEYNREASARSTKNVPHKGEFQLRKSRMRKLQNEINAEKRLLKLQEEINNNRKKGKGVSYDET